VRVLGNKLHRPAHGYGCDSQDDSAQEFSPRYGVLFTVIHPDAGSKRNERECLFDGECRRIGLLAEGFGRATEIFAMAVAKWTNCGV
jgi:hypothetical protein